MNRLSSRILYRFGIQKLIKDSLYIIDKDYEPYQVTAQSMYGTNINTTPYNSQAPRYQSTKLDSGITVLTESVVVPSTVQLGILIDAGSRDQDAETSGTMLALKNTYLKTAINTNETVNYGVNQMSGGDFEVNFDRESIYYKASCLSHDVIDVFGVVADCAFEPKNVVAASVAQMKNEDTFKVDAVNGGNQQFVDNIFAAAYGRQTLGNPLNGSRANISNLSAYIIQQFQQANLNPNRVTISAGGIENHQEFVDLVAEKMHLTQLSASSYQRQPAQYVGGQIKNYNDSSNVHVAVGFEGASHANAWALHIANYALGTGRKTGILQKNILDKNIFINDAQSFNNAFSDSGVFGLKLAGSASHVNQIVNVAAKTLSELRNISESDVQRAKAVLKGSLRRNTLNDNGKRLGLQTKASYYLGRPVENIESHIDSITAADVQAAVSKALSSPLTFVAQGGQVHKIPSYDKVSQLFN